MVSIMGGARPAHVAFLQQVQRRWNVNGCTCRLLPRGRSVARLHPLCHLSHLHIVRRLSLLTHRDTGGPPRQ